jgi:hypothetical protein
VTPKDAIDIDDGAAIDAANPDKRLPGIFWLCLPN